MGKAALLALADRVEALTGLDREVDAQIFRTTECAPPFQYLNKLIALSWHEQEQAYFAQVSDDMRVRYEPPNYTASIDAAMTLVPEGWVMHGLSQTPDIVQEEHTGEEPLPKWSAALLRQGCAGYRNRKKFMEAFARGASNESAAIAITAAALRAIAGGEDAN